jgi:GT2 family glycosyltransferase
VTDISVVVVSYDTCGLLQECLASIPKEVEGVSMEVWVVDNASSDGSPEMVARQFPDVNLIRNSRNVGFASANNQAIRQSRGELVYFLNSDAVLLPGSLPVLASKFSHHPKLGICGACLLNSDGSLQPSWGGLPSVFDEFLFQSFLFKLWPSRFPYGRRVHALQRNRYGRFQWVDWVTGAALMVRREVLEITGGFPEVNFMYGEDLELCVLAARAGFLVGYEPAAKVIHRLYSSSHHDHSRWIENYTQAILSYYRRYAEPDTCRRAARLIIWGSRLRQMIWLGLGKLLPGRGAEAHMRRRGYGRAVALARSALS